MCQNEDEWVEIQQRFKAEGIDAENLKPNERIIHIWRWLVDAEINLKNSRRMYDKLREHQNEELEEMENYVGRIRELSEKRTIDLDNENVKMHQQLDTISSILDRLGLQGDSVTEKVSNLVSDYIKLTEEVQVLNKLKQSHPHSDDLISEIIAVSSEKEILKRKVIEMTERVQLLQKNSRELEIDNEKLAFKLSEAFAELEEKDIRLGECTTMLSGDSSGVFNSVNYSQQRDTNNSTFSHNDMQESDRTDEKDMSQGYRTDSAPPSFILSDMIDYKSASKLSNLMSSCHEMARLEENKKLQSECETMKVRIATLSDRYNIIALKYIQLKAKKKFQIEELRGRLDASLCQIESLQVQLSVQRQRLRAEEIFRKQIESDLCKLQDEKRSIIVRLQNSELEQKENNREMHILQKKISVLDAANSELLAQLFKLKYKETSDQLDINEIPIESS